MANILSSKDRKSEKDNCRVSDTCNIQDLLVTFTYTPCVLYACTDSWNPCSGLKGIALTICSILNSIYIQNSKGQNFPIKRNW